PSKWRMLRSTRTSRQVRDGISEKIGVKCQTSQRYARLNILPFVKMLSADRDYAVRLAAWTNLDTAEIAYIIGSKKDTKKVKTIHQNAQDLVEDVAPEEVNVFDGFESRAKVAQGKPEKKDKPGKPMEPKKPEKKQDTKPEKKSQTSLFDF
ncbi:MAG: hypothetical protein KAS74_00930, partial [Methanosarcinales archaeon]|nr:hypothetical protein [Methanosarcinales archaeon]